MFNNVIMKNSLNILNDLESDSEERVLAGMLLLNELIGDAVYGVNYELTIAILKLVDSFENMIFVQYKGSLYLIDSKLSDSIYSIIDNNKLDLVNNYLKIDNESLEIRDYEMNYRYDLKKPNHLKSYYLTELFYNETEMFYDDEGKEYYRIIKTNTYDDSSFRLNGVLNLKRINSEQVLVSSSFSFGKADSLNMNEQRQEPYIVNYDGINLAINLEKYNHEPVDKESLDGKSKK